MGSAGSEQGQEGGPRREDLIAGDGAHVLEQADSRPELATRLLPQGFGEFAGRVHGEGEQVEDDQNAGEGVLAMAEVVLEMVAVLLEDVEGLVLDLPAGACAGGEFGDAVEVLVEGLVAVRLAGEQEVAAAVEHRPADRLAGVQVVAQIDGPQWGAAGTVALQLALGRLPFAVLLEGAVLGTDERRRQRRRLGLAGATRVAASI